MSDRPILFSGEMVRAILDRQKSQTRRVVRPQPEPDLGYMLVNGKARPVGADYPDQESEAVACPYGKPGDRLWVRETWCRVDDFYNGGTQWTDYRATPRYSAEHPAGWENAPDDPEALKWRPSIFMPRWASRLTLEITDVRVERVQAISEADCEAEGVECPQCGGKNWSECGGEACQCTHPDCGDGRALYRELWDALNAKRGFGWDVNPWVWVISFTRVEELSSVAVSGGEERSDNG